MKNKKKTLWQKKQGFYAIPHIIMITNIIKLVEHQSSIDLTDVYSYVYVFIIILLVPFIFMSFQSDIYIFIY